MSDKVVAIRGAILPVQAKPEPDPEVVDYLKSLMEMAEAGDLHGLAGISTHLGERFSVHRVGACVSASVVGELELLKLRIAVETFGDDEDDD